MASARRGASRLRAAAASAVFRRSSARSAALMPASGQPCSACTARRVRGRGAHARPAPSAPAPGRPSVPRAFLQVLCTLRRGSAAPLKAPRSGKPPSQVRRAPSRCRGGNGDAANGRTPRALMAHTCAACGCVLVSGPPLHAGLQRLLASPSAADIHMRDLNVRACRHTAPCQPLGWPSWKERPRCHCPLVQNPATVLVTVRHVLLVPPDQQTVCSPLQIASHPLTLQGRQSWHCSRDFLLCTSAVFISKRGGRRRRHTHTARAPVLISLAFASIDHASSCNHTPVERFVAG